MEEKKRYLKWYNKVGYGMGDWGCIMIYGTINSFLMLYLTDIVGLNSGIIGTLILASKLLDGVSDIIFGSLIDRTRTKMGRARPWMLYSEFGNALMLILLFTIPDMGDMMQYVYFFICYTLLNAVFYTVNNIAYSALTALITKNSEERVQLGTIRFLFSTGSSLILTYLTVWLVPVLGGGAAGWRSVAIIYAIVALIINAISVFSVHELSDEELNAIDPADEEAAKALKDDKLSLIESLKLLLSNKFFVFLTIMYALAFLQDSTVLGYGVYYTTYVLGNANLLGTFQMTNSIPIIISLVCTPFLVKKFGMYKTNLVALAIGLIGRIAMFLVGGTNNVPLLVALSCVAWIGVGPLFGMINALISEASEYTFRKTKHRIDGMMFSANSLGSKIGNGVGTAVCGWLLAAGGYNGLLDVQSAGAINMIRFIYLGLPVIEMALMLLTSFFADVEKANRSLDAAEAQ